MKHRKSGSYLGQSAQGFRSTLIVISVIIVAVNVVGLALLFTGYKPRGSHPTGNTTPIPEVTYNSQLRVDVEPRPTGAGTDAAKE